jgi:hypothetical protein
MAAATIWLGVSPVTDERLLAAKLFNETWRLMEQEQRTRDDRDRMIHAAHSSRYQYTDQALAAPKKIADNDDRALVLADLETIPGQPRYW